jgi:hypothetical protein
VQKLRKDVASGSLKSTEIGRLNRKIEKSVSGVFVGTPGAASEALSLAKRREQYLFAKPASKKVPA